MKMLQNDEAIRIGAIASAPTQVLWPLERILFATAGTVVLLSAVLAAVVSPWFLLLTAFVGVNQWLFVAFGACPVSLVLRRVGATAQCNW
jgi:Zn-dependent protease